MKETGIIMSGNHPKLVIDGLKTKTRRTQGLEVLNIHNDPNDWVYLYPKPSSPNHYFRFDNNLEPIQIKCPYGQVGDRLWVRETHYRWGHWVRNGITETGRQKWVFWADGNGKGVCYLDNPPALIPVDRTVIGWNKRPSIHMPRWASRITLEITEVRVERVQDIIQSDRDMVAEGIPLITYDNNRTDWGEMSMKFLDLWDSLNAKRGYGWEVNPWVWVINFKVVENGED